MSDRNEPRTGIDHACDWPGCIGQCHTGDTCPCHPEAGAAPSVDELDGDTLRDLTEIVGKALYGWGDDEPNAATGHIALKEVASISAAIYDAGYRRLSGAPQRVVYATCYEHGWIRTDAPCPTCHGGSHEGNQD